jgi:hypothetical protein
MSTCKHDANRSTPFPAIGPSQSAQRIPALFRDNGPAGAEKAVRAGYPRLGAASSCGPAETSIEPVHAETGRRFAPRSADT